MDKITFCCGASAAALCTAAVVAAFQIWASFPKQHNSSSSLLVVLRTRLRRSLAKQHQQAFVLMVSLEFPDEAAKEQFKELWQQQAAVVHAQEPGTLAFELLQPDTQPNQLLVFERFISKDYYLQQHRTSPALARLKQLAHAAGCWPQVSGQSYNELNIGFM